MPTSPSERKVSRHVMDLLYRIAVSMAVLAASASAHCQVVEYQRITVAGRLSITVPAHWHVRDELARRDIAAFADASADPKESGAAPMHVASLSVVSPRQSPQVIVRASFVDEPGSQEELNRDVALDKDRVVSELAAAWKKQAQALSAKPGIQGVRYLGDERFDVVAIGGKSAMVVSYRRSSVSGGSPFRVFQYHVPMGSDTILITISLQESASALLGPVLERVKSSIAISR